MGITNAHIHMITEKMPIKAFKAIYLNMLESLSLLWFGGSAFDQYSDQGTDGPNQRKAPLYRHPYIYNIQPTDFDLKLLVHLIHHPETGCTNGMSEAFEPPVRLIGDLTIRLKKPFRTSLPAFPCGEIPRSS